MKCKTKQPFISHTMLPLPGLYCPQPAQPGTATTSANRQKEWMSLSRGASLPDRRTLPSEVSPPSA